MPERQNSGLETNLSKKTFKKLPTFFEKGVDLYRYSFQIAAVATILGISTSSLAEGEKKQNNQTHNLKQDEHKPKSDVRKYKRDDRKPKDDGNKRIEGAHKDEDKDDHQSEQFKIEVGFTFDPTQNKTYGFDMHFVWIPKPENHDKPHWEIVVLDWAVSTYTVEVHSNLNLLNKKDSILGREMHIASMLLWAIPMNKHFELSFGGGLGFAMYQHGTEKVGYDSRGVSYSVKSHTQRAPILQFEVEGEIEIAKNIFAVGAYNPHLSLKPVSHEIPTKKHTDIDHVFVLGVGASF